MYCILLGQLGAALFNFGKPLSCLCHDFLNILTIVVQTPKNCIVLLPYLNVQHVCNIQTHANIYTLCLTQRQSLTAILHVSIFFIHSRKNLFSRTITMDATMVVMAKSQSLMMTATRLKSLTKMKVESGGEW